MKTFSTTVEEQLTKGLRADARRRTDTFELVVCRRAKPTEHGLSANETITNPLHSPPAVDWPYPQIMRGSSHTLVGTRDAIYETFECSGWPLVRQLLFDLETQTESAVIQSGGQWHFADFGPSWIATNGQTCVFKPNYAEVFDRFSIAPDRDAKVFASTRIAIRTVAFYHGRLFYGGFCPGDAGTTWETLDPNHIMWSMAGGGDCFWPFDPSLRPDEYLKDYAKRTDHGFAKMPFKGTVLAMKPLGDDLIVYGSDGIALCRTAIVEQFPTLSVRELLPFGIADRGCVSGDMSEHVFLDEKGDLWRLGTQGGPQRLGYREFLSPFLCNEPILTFDPDEREHYIAAGTASAEGFVLTPQGLGGCAEKPISLLRSEGTLLGTFAPAPALPPAPNDAATLIESSRFTFRNIGIKRLNAIHVDTEDMTDIETSAYHRFGKQEAEFQTDWQPVNDANVGHPFIEGQEHRVAIRGNFTSDDGRIDFLKLDFQDTDSRERRGVGGDTGIGGNA